MFGIGGFELFIILIFGFLIFGPEKLPEMARLVGRGIARFRQAQEEMNDVIKTTDIYDPNSDEPFKDPMEALDKLARHQEEKKAAKDKQTPAPKASSAVKGEGKAKDASSAAPAAAASAAASADTPRQESFTERKARYERERAARKAAEAAETEGKASEPAADVATTAQASEPAQAEGGEQ